MLPKTIIEAILTQDFHYDEEKLAALTAAAEKEHKSLEEAAIDAENISEVDLYTAAAKALNVPFTTLHDKEIAPEVLHLIPGPLAETHSVIAFDRTDKDVSLAMLDPTDIQTIEFLRRKIGLTPTVYLATPTDIKDSLRKLHHADIERDVSKRQLATNTPKDLKKAAEEGSTVTLVSTILEHAIYEGASDIHIEPTEKELQVRYRVDGVLETAMTLPKDVQSGVVARIKVLANLKIDEHMVPQDGRFKLTLNDEDLSLRVSIMPVYDGEKIVMRILHEEKKALALDQLGFLPGPKKIIENSIDKPHGMILVTGPTGSGKTTTLYTILNMLNEPGVNICTIEDPIEYHVQGINQSQINPRVGFTFAGGLRAFLRQDPDIIMVGEIRDQETAEIAIHAAMTGHLVLSTLHTNDAPTTLPRLLDMDIPPFLVAFTVNTIIAQRLVRKICDNCREEYHLDEKEIEELGKIADIEKMMTLFKEQEIKLGSAEKNFKTMSFSRGKGCNRCNMTGYKGRVGIYEVLEVDPSLAKKINERATVDDVKAYAKEHGMVTLLEDGIIKAKQGVTTIEEVLRATRE
ncbi:MAG TPA: GspE/PulE family protein [Candidatus Kapabacteria bacterium]|nr:GspE/PulE family protein [Candidatus Kapabacteria bacterium]